MDEIEAVWEGDICYLAETKWSMLDIEIVFLCGLADEGGVESFDVFGVD